MSRDKCSGDNTTELRGVLEELADLKEIKELLEIILENAYDGIVMVDEQAKITFLKRDGGRNGKYT
ncbi:MAG: hypothetical protein KGZ96_11470 [Clostridia bacterium]|jgi:PAS domain-containing protein|nr:hypothetical protein [Clostridia bacterium]